MISLVKTLPYIFYYFSKKEFLQYFTLRLNLGKSDRQKWFCLIFSVKCLSSSFVYDFRTNVVKKNRILSMEHVFNEFQGLVTRKRIEKTDTFTKSILFVSFIFVYVNVRPSCRIYCTSIIWWVLFH